MSDRRQSPAAGWTPPGEPLLDGGVTTLVLGFFSMMWFSWGQADASPALSTALTVGRAAALAVALLGAIRTYRHRREEGALQDGAARRSYGLVVGVEFGLAGGGAAILGASGAAAYIPVWICCVVGLHFFPLASLFGDPKLRALGAVVTAVAALALVVGVFTDVLPGVVTGSGAGLALLAFSILTLAGPSIRMFPTRSQRDAAQGP